MTRERIPLALTCLALAMLARPADAQTPPATPAANPARPTVSTPATLTPVGYLQFETGVLVARDSAELSTQFSVNEVAKLAVHRRVQLLLQLEPYARSGSSGQPAEQAAGGTAAGLQCVVFDGGETRPTVAVSYFHALSDGSAPDLDIGSAKQSLLFLVSGDVAGFHIDSNAMLNQQADGDLRRAQHGQTLSVSHGVGAVTIAGELWHFTQPFFGTDAAGMLWAVSYAARPNLVFDAGFNRGLTSTSTRWEFFGGFTYLLPRSLKN